MLKHAFHPFGVSSSQSAWLVLGVFVGVILSGCGAGMTPEQKNAIQKLQTIGARVNFKRGGCEVDLTNTPVEDQDLVHARNIPHLILINLQGTRITDTGLEHLHAIDTLEIVYLQRTLTTPEAVEKLRQTIPKAEVNH